MLWRLIHAAKRRLGVLQTKTPIRRWEDIFAPEISAKFFASVMGSEPAVASANDIRKGRFTCFSHHRVDTGVLPDWFANPLEKGASGSRALSDSHWSKIPDFEFGDIKCIWELSRFAWVYPLAQAFGATGDLSYADTCRLLIADWAQNNPPNQGVHWKCGQEIAIRMMALTTAYFAFENADNGSAGRRLIRRILFASAQRIEADIGYALSQDNNHGLSEATGLFTAGVLFGHKAWIRKGKSILERQVRDLLYTDGSFSQHSANYHRMVLHICLWAMAMGGANNSAFSERFIDKIRSAGRWMTSLCDPVSGRMPNLGSNDGALVLPVSQCPYEDFRPTIQAVGVLTDHCRWLDDGEWNDLALWIGSGDAGGKTGAQNQPARSGQPWLGSLYLPDGGYAVISRSAGKLIFRCPKGFRHRPAQCDLLHVDLWLDGSNILRDAGTYSYNCPQPWQDYFKSNAAHNTIQFDDHQQMPKISRFLYGRWPELSVKQNNARSVFQAGFTDWKGCFHQRDITITQGGYQVKDTISGFANKAVLRWRLAPEMDWQLKDHTCTADPVTIEIYTCPGQDSIRLVKGWESLFYQARQPIPVLEAIVGPACNCMVTRIRFS